VPLSKKESIGERIKQQQKKQTMASKAKSLFFLSNILKGHKMVAVIYLFPFAAGLLCMDIPIFLAIFFIFKERTCVIY